MIIQLQPSDLSVRVYEIYKDAQKINDMVISRRGDSYYGAVVGADAIYIGDTMEDVENFILLYAEV